MQAVRGAPREETALEPLRLFAAGEQGNRSWSSLRKGLEHVSGSPRDRPLYDATFFGRRVKGEGLAYPPTTLLVLDLARALGPARALLRAAIWIAVPLTAVLVALLDRRVGGGAATRAERWTRVGLAALATVTFYPLMRGYADGDVDALATAAFAGALLAWQGGRKGAAGALMGLTAAAFRPLAVFLLPWAIVRGERRFAAGFAVGAVPLLAGAIARYGLESHLDYLGVLRFLFRRGESITSNQSVNGMLHRLVGDAPALERVTSGDPGWIAHFPAHHPLVQAGTLAAAAVFLLAALWPPRANAPRGDAADFGLAVLATTLAAPIAWESHYGILLPLFVLLLHRLPPAAGLRRALGAVWVVAAIPGWLLNPLAATDFSILQSSLLLAAIATLALLYVVREGEARAKAPAPGWGPAAHRLGLAAMVGALAWFTVATDLVSWRTGLLPYWDPEVFYMLNSLLPFKGHTYTFIDHPGTPVEMIGTVLLAGMWPAAAARSQSVAELAIGQPWLFLALGHALLTVASAAVVVLLARRSLALRRWDDVLLSLAVACSFFVLHARAFETLVYWSHNSFNFAAGGLVGFALYAGLRDGAPPSRRWLLGMGIAAGGLAAVQLYMGAWVIGISASVATLLLLRGLGARTALRAVAVVCVGGAAGFVLFTLPIASRYLDFLRWVRFLAVRQGVYGSGGAGFSMDEWTANAAAIVAGHRAAFLAVTALAAAIAVAAVRSRHDLRRDAGRWAVGLGLTVQVLVLAAAIFKHPGPLYVLSVAAAGPFLMALAFASWRDRGWLGRAACAAAAAVVVAGFAGACAREIRTAGRYPLRAADGQEAIAARLLSLPGGAPPLRVWSVGNEAPCFGLWVANLNPLRAFTPEITAVCPRDGMAWYDLVEFPDGWLALPPGTAHGVLITAQRILETQPSVRWGEPVVTDVESPFLGRVIFVPFDDAKLRAMAKSRPSS